MAEQKWADGIQKLEEKGLTEGKRCPLVGGFRCLEQGCAWWNHIDGECSIVTLATLATIEIDRRGR